MAGNGYTTESVHVLTLQPGEASDSYAYTLAEELLLCVAGKGECLPCRTLGSRWSPETCPTFPRAWPMPSATLPGMRRISFWFLKSPRPNSISTPSRLLSGRQWHDELRRLFSRGSQRSIGRHSHPAGFCLPRDGIRRPLMESVRRAGPPRGSPVQCLQGQPVGRAGEPSRARRMARGGLAPLGVQFLLQPPRGRPCAHTSGFRTNASSSGPARPGSTWATRENGSMSRRSTACWPRPESFTRPPLRPSRPFGAASPRLPSSI